MGSIPSRLNNHNISLFLIPSLFQEELTKSRSLGYKVRQFDDLRKRLLRAIPTVLFVSIKFDMVAVTVLFESTIRFPNIACHFSNVFQTNSPGLWPRRVRSSTWFSQLHSTFIDHDLSGPPRGPADGLTTTLESAVALNTVRQIQGTLICCSQFREGQN